MKLKSGEIRKTLGEGSFGEFSVEHDEDEMSVRILNPGTEQRCELET